MKNGRFRVTVHAPILKPFPVNSFLIRDIYQKAIADLQSRKHVLHAVVDSKDTEIILRIIKTPTRLKRVSQSYLLGDDKTLQASSRILVDKAAFVRTVRETNKGLREQSDENIVSWIPIYLIEEYRIAVSHILTALSLSKPGALRFGHFYIKVGSTGETVQEVHPTDIEYVRAIATECGWPSIEDIPFETAIQWLRGVPGLEDGKPAGPVGRAIAALSYMIGCSAEVAPPLALMLSMLALEALYTSGTEGIRRELFGKVEALLGLPIKKVLYGKLYDYRSRFIHGNMDFPVAYAPSIVEHEFSKDARRHAGIAAAILISTLQDMIKRNTYELSFHYEIQ